MERGISKINFTKMFLQHLEQHQDRIYQDVLVINSKEIEGNFSKNYLVYFLSQEQVEKYKHLFTAQKLDEKMVCELQWLSLSDYLPIYQVGNGFYLKFHKNPSFCSEEELLGFICLTGNFEDKIESSKEAKQKVKDLLERNPKPFIHFLFMVLYDFIKDYQEMFEVDEYCAFIQNVKPVVRKIYEKHSKRL